MDVAVVGAGLTGLAAVEALRSRGFDVRCFEARDHPGGVVSSGRIDGIVVEHGPQRLRLSEAVAARFEALGLEDELRTAPGDAPIYVYREGRLREVPFDAATAIRTDAISWRGKLRLLKEPLTDGHRPGESAAAYFRRKLGEEAYRAVIEPLFGGLYASDPAEMPASVALRPLLALEARRGSLARIALGRLARRGDRPPTAVPDAGMAELPRRMAAAHADAMHLGEPVTGIEGTGTDLEVSTPAGSYPAERVVVATDAPSAAEVLDDLAPAVSDRLRALRYNPLALVYLRAPVDRRGLGYQVARDEPLRTLGVAWNGRAFGRDDLVTAFLGGMHDPAILERPDEELMAIAARELESVLNVTASPLGVHRVEPGMPAYDRSFEQLRDVELPTGLHLVGNYTDRLGVPGRLRQGRRVADAIAGESTRPVAPVLEGGSP
ncbi:MAG: protoporphyrinogen oxidase [Halobacteriota archaeon]